MTSTSAATPRTPSATPNRRNSRILIAFFAAAYLLPWTVWGSRIADDHGWIGWHLPLGIALWTLLPVTLTAVAITGGRAGLHDHWHRLCRWRVPARWYGTALGLPLALAGLAALGGLATGGRPQFGVTISLNASLVYLAYGVGLFLLTEESAWRGFALPQLMTRLSPLAASLLLGGIWACWHIPTFLLSTEANSAIPFPGFAVMTVATSVITAWLYVGTRGSILIPAVFHAAIDAAYSYTGVVGTDHHVFWTAVALEVVAAVTLAVTQGPSLHSRRRPSPQGTGTAPRLDEHRPAWS